jgi:hypothetical protein
MAVIRSRGFDNAIHWANRHALGRIVVTLALNAGCLVDHIQDTITFTNGFGGAFRDTGTASDAVIFNYHGHGLFLLSEIYL